MTRVIFVVVLTFVWNFSIHLSERDTQCRSGGCQQERKCRCSPPPPPPKKKGGGGGGEEEKFTLLTRQKLTVRNRIRNRGWDMSHWVSSKLHLKSSVVKCGLMWEKNLPGTKMENWPTGKRAGGSSLLPFPQSYSQRLVQWAYFLRNCTTEKWGSRERRVEVR